MYVYRCQDSLESIFTAIYKVYEDRRSREEVLLSLDDEPMLFSTEIDVEEDEDRYSKVIRTLRNRFGSDNYEDICLALASPDPEKAQAVYGTIAAGLQNQCGRGHLFDSLADADVNKAFKLARNAGRENCHLRGFTRFEELEQGIMYARIGPKNNLLTFLMPHFADRFPEENFVLYDDVRNLFGVHPAAAQQPTVAAEISQSIALPSVVHLGASRSAAYQGAFPSEAVRRSGETASRSATHQEAFPSTRYTTMANQTAGTDCEAWYLLRGEDLSAENIQLSAEEYKYQSLFKEFCRSIAIGERRNLELQRGMLPLRFQEYMTEFQ